MSGYGYTTTSTMTNVLPTTIAKARLYNEFGTVMSNLVTNIPLGKGEGSSINIPKVDQFTATSLSEGVAMTQAQRMSTTNQNIAVSEVGIQFLVTDRVRDMAKENVFDLLSKAASNGMRRKLDKDLIAYAITFSSSFPGTGATPVPGNIFAAVTRITGNSTEPPDENDPIVGVMHPKQWHPIARNLMGLQTAGSYNSIPVPSGISQDLLKNFYLGELGTVKLFRDGNITVDSVPDAKGAIFAKGAILYINYDDPKDEMFRVPGGRGTLVDMVSMYGAAIYQDAWGVTLYSAAANPTS